MMYEVVRCGRLSVCKDDFKNSITSDLVVQADVKDGPGLCRQRERLVKGSSFRSLLGPKDEHADTWGRR